MDQKSVISSKIMRCIIDCSKIKIKLNNEKGGFGRNLRLKKIQLGGAKKF